MPLIYTEFVEQNLLGFSEQWAFIVKINVRSISIDVNKSAIRLQSLMMNEIISRLCVDVCGCV